MTGRHSPEVRITLLAARLLIRGRPSPAASRTLQVMRADFMQDARRERAELIQGIIRDSVGPGEAS